MFIAKARLAVPADATVPGRPLEVSDQFDGELVMVAFPDGHETYAMFSELEAITPTASFDPSISDQDLARYAAFPHLDELLGGGAADAVQAELAVRAAKKEQERAAKEEADRAAAAQKAENDRLAAAQAEQDRIARAEQFKALIAEQVRAEMAKLASA